MKWLLGCMVVWQIDVARLDTWQKVVGQGYDMADDV
jgi:hypothetical protein